jgi:O-antigen/teichoic acid export membrane protein
VAGLDEGHIGVRSLLAKGIFDSIIQFAATAGVRFALIASIPLMAIFLPPEDVAKFDLFVVGANFFLIIIALGVDSGLGVVSAARTERRRKALLSGAIIIVVVSSVLVFVPVAASALVGRPMFGLQSIDFTLMYAYSLPNAIMLVVFSYYRWIGRAVAASLLIIVSNGLGLSIGFGILFFYESILGLQLGLVFGGILGALLCLLFAVSDKQLQHTLGSESYTLSVTLRLLKISLPFVVASLLLLARRFVDRGLLISMGTMALLGGYAAVSRSGELLAFAMAVPSIGLSPIVLKHAADDRGKRIAGHLYFGYMCASVVATVAACWVWVAYGEALFSEAAAPIAPVFIATIVGSLLFGQTAVAGYGFILKQSTNQIAALAGLFIFLYILIATPFIVADNLIGAIGVGFVGASLIYGAVFINLSERKVFMGYPQKRIFLVNSLLAASAIAAIFV